MAISAQLNRLLHDIFMSRGYVPLLGFTGPGLNLEKDNIFKLFLNVDITGNEVDVPLMCRSIVEAKIKNNFNIESEEDKTKRVSITLLENGSSQVRRSASTIFKTFATLPLRDRILKIVTPKGEVYYGNRGFILDKDYNLLILYVLHAVKNADNTWTYKTGRIYVNPRVFTSNGLVEKHIIKTIIPAFIEQGIKIDTYNNNIPGGIISQEIYLRIEGTYSYTLPIPEIMIADVTDKFITIPKKLSPATFNSDAMNDFLLEHLEEVAETSDIL